MWHCCIGSVRGNDSKRSDSTGWHVTGIQGSLLRRVVQRGRRKVKAVGSRVVGIAVREEKWGEFRLLAWQAQGALELNLSLLIFVLVVLVVLVGSFKDANLTFLEVSGAGGNEVVQFSGDDVSVLLLAKEAFLVCKIRVAKVVLFVAVTVLAASGSLMVHDRAVGVVTVAVAVANAGRG